MVSTMYSTLRVASWEAILLVNWSSQSAAEATMKNSPSWMTTERTKTALYCVRICMEAPMRLNVLQPKAYIVLKGRGVGRTGR